MRLADRLLAGRLAPDAVFPAGHPGHEVRMVPLADGLRVRVIHCPPAPPPADAPPPRPVLFVHGWGVSAYTWHRNLRAVADAGVPVWAFDLKGHGYSEKPATAGDYSLQALARHTLEVMDALGLERAVIAGHSMGGGISVRVATLAPARVALALAYGSGTRPSPRDVDEYWAPTADPAFVRVVREVTRSVDWRPGRAEELAQVRCPAIVMFGTHDRIVRPDSAGLYVRHLPDARLELVRGAGHVLPEEVPDRVNAAIVEGARGWR